MIVYLTATSVLSQVNGPRHENSVCSACLEAHAVGALRGGRLFVACPAEGCGRSLQTLELRAVVPAADYDLLVERLREVNAGDEGGRWLGGWSRWVSEPRRCRAQAPPPIPPNGSSHLMSMIAQKSHHMF